MPRGRVVRVLSVDGDFVFEPGAYAAIPTRAARVEALIAARRLATRHVVLDVRVASVGTHVGRVVRDWPRRLLRRGEPGDRVQDGVFVHAFFDDEALLEEIRAAGLFVVSREARRWVLATRVDTTPSFWSQAEADSFWREVARVLAIVASVERERLRGAPEANVRAARKRGRQGQKRGAVGRARLVRAIGWVDALMKENCYRRVLLELSLDAGAAAERIVFSLDVGATGHVAFEGREDAGFDVAFTMEPD